MVKVRGSIPGLTATISEIGYLLLPSRDMAEISLKRRKSSKQPTKTIHCIRKMALVRDNKYHYELGEMFYWKCNKDCTAFTKVCGEKEIAKLILLDAHVAVGIIQRVSRAPVREVS